MPNDIVTTNEIQIQQLVVEIKAIKVGKRQMTQGLFRQLPKRSIIDDTTYQIQGTPWCTVNYFWGDCSPDHLHVVWQQGDKVYRDCLFAPGKRSVTRGEVLARKYREEQELLLDKILVLLISGRMLGLKSEKIGLGTYKKGEDYACSVSNLCYEHPGWQALPITLGKGLDCYSKLCGALSSRDQLIRQTTELANAREGNTKNWTIEHFEQMVERTKKIHEKNYEELEDCAQVLVRTLCNDVKLLDLVSLEVVSDMLPAQCEKYQLALVAERQAPIKHQQAYDKVTKDLEQFYIAV